ncbi:MAG: hypothetical protein NTW32_22620 [Chloroflexi bacterium]|nr:hypothetical protein [Chloroflexota bacterium]
MTKFDPEIHHRHSIRLPGYDYSQAGAYYVTIVAQARECLFGEVDNGEMKLSSMDKLFNPLGSICPNITAISNWMLFASCPTISMPFWF